jgi:hypothetical protein
MRGQHKSVAYLSDQEREGIDHALPGLNAA